MKKFIILMSSVRTGRHFSMFTDSIICDSFESALEWVTEEVESYCKDGYKKEYEINEVVYEITLRKGKNFGVQVVVKEA